MMRSTFLLLAVLALGGCAPSLASASFLTGNQLKEFCDKSPNTLDGADCAGYVIGVSDAFAASMAIFSTPKIYCPPPQVTPGQLMAMTQKYLTQNPEYGHLDASSIIFNMLSQQFPCPK
jgi:Rap1a immunity proteins